MEKPEFLVDSRLKSTPGVIDEGGLSVLSGEEMKRRFRG